VRREKVDFMSSAFDFTNKSVVVTGASRGIGYGVAEAFARHGAKVHILASGEGIFSAGEKLSSIEGYHVKSYQCDISRKDEVDNILSKIDQIDVLVNNAGLERPTPIASQDSGIIADFERIISINVLGTFYVSHAAIPKIPKGGSIIITSSIWGKTAVAEFSAYCASKHANIGFMRSLSKELGPAGIRVNAVCPGWVETEAAMKSLKWMSQKNQTTEKDLLKEIVDAQSIDGLMRPEDISQTYLFLASHYAANITGQAINVDRGEVLG